MPTQEDFNSMPWGPTLGKDTRIVRGKGHNAVYLIVDGTKRHITDPKTFDALGFDWSKIQEIDMHALDQIKRGKDVSLATQKEMESLEDELEEMAFGCQQDHRGTKNT